MKVSAVLIIAVCLAIGLATPVWGQEQGPPPVTFVVEPVYETIGPFSEGLALAATGGKVGYIDAGGAVVIDAQFDGGGTFSGGLAVVNVSGDHCFIDHTGTVVVRTPYDWLEPYAEERALFRYHDAYGFIDRAGNVVIEAVYDRATPLLRGAGGGHGRRHVGLHR